MMSDRNPRARSLGASVQVEKHGEPSRVFVSYSHMDEDDRVRLDVHLAPLVRERIIDLWCNRMIPPGADWERGIEDELANADIVILLVTADFVKSVYCFEKELTAALRRHQEQGVRIVPVIVKPVDFRNLPFGRFQALPRDLRPISTWDNVDAAWLEVALGVRALVEDIHRSPAVVPAQRNGSGDLGATSLLGQELESFYGGNNCVIDGSAAEDRGIDWVPLDEKSPSMRFDNLVPVSSRHRDKSRATFRFGIDLIAESLFHSARRHFHSGAPELAFGCAWLGDALVTRYPDLLEAHDGDDWVFLTQGLFYLPYRMHAGLLEAALLRVRRRIDAADSCPDTARTAMLLAIANVYQDIGSWTKADELHAHVLSISTLPTLRAAAIRRRAVGALFRGTERHAMDRELRSIVKYRTSADLSVSLAICRGWWHLAAENPERCLRELEPFDFDEEAPIPAPTYSPHNMVEFKLTQASALADIGLGFGSQLRFVRQRNQTRLRPVFTDHIAPLLLAPQLAETIESLRTKTPIASPALDAAAGAILAARGTPTPMRPIWVD